MLTHPTVDQLVKLGLAGMARAFTELQGNQSAAGLGHAEWLALLLEREATERSNRQLTARMRHARLRQRATIEDIDWRSPRGLDRSLFQRLIAGDWIDAPQNLIADAILDRIVHNERMPNDHQPAGARHPGRNRSESMAGFNRNQVADINRNARPTSSEYAFGI